MDALGRWVTKFHQRTADRMSLLLTLNLVSYVTLVNVNDVGEL